MALIEEIFKSREVSKEKQGSNRCKTEREREECEQTGSPTVLGVHGYKEVCLLFITTYMCGINMPLQI